MKFLFITFLFSSQLFAQVDCSVKTADLPASDYLFIEHTVVVDSVPNNKKMEVVGRVLGIYDSLKKQAAELKLVVHEDPYTLEKVPQDPKKLVVLPVKTGPGTPESAKSRLRSRAAGKYLVLSCPRLVPKDKLDQEIKKQLGLRKLSANYDHLFVNIVGGDPKNPKYTMNVYVPIGK